ncbi:hypothetical protein PFISCL1PPCAC_15081, partial [Pristionchus fissidentatus]
EEGERGEEEEEQQGRSDRPTALVTCASYKMAEEMIERLSVNNFDVTIVGENAEKLNSIAKEKRLRRGEQLFTPVCLNLRDFDQVKEAMEGQLKHHYDRVVFFACAPNYDEPAPEFEKEGEHVHVGFRSNVVGHFLMARYLIERSVDSTKSTRFIFVAPNVAGFDDNNCCKEFPANEELYDDFFKHDKPHLKEDLWNNYTRIGFIAVAEAINRHFSSKASAVAVFPHDDHCRKLKRRSVKDYICEYFCTNRTSIGVVDQGLELTHVSWSQFIFTNTIENDISQYDKKWLEGTNPRNLPLNESQIEKFFNYLNWKTRLWGFN